MALNFAQQRKLAAKQASSIQNKDKMPGCNDGLDKDYMSKPNFMNSSGNGTDITDTGWTIVNKPNGNYTKENYGDSQQVVALKKYKKAK